MLPRPAIPPCTTTPPRRTRTVHRRLAAACAIVLAGASTAALPAPGDLDASFANDGVLFLEGPTGDPEFRGDDHVTALLPLPDGSVLAAGSFDQGLPDYNDLALVRFTREGVEDAGFGTGGRTAIQLPGDQDSANALLRQPDGRIVIAGAIEPFANTNFGIARFNADGTPDTGFGDPDGLGGRLGHAQVNVGTSTAANDYATAVARQAGGANAGKLVVAGSGLAADGAICCYRRFGLVRFNADGTLDTGFGGAGANGIVIAPPSVTGAAEYPTAIATYTDATYADGTLPSDRITVVGLLGSPTNPSKALVRRYLANGTPDTSFDGDGLLVIDDPLIGGQYDGLRSVDAAVYQPDGKLLLVGRAGDRGFTFLRLNPNGTRDTGFGASGRTSVKFSASTFFDEPAALALQPNGKIVAAGYFTGPAGADFGVVRLLPDGAPDTGFGTGGRATHALVAATDTAMAVAILADGSILAAGLAQRPGVPNLQTDMAFLRLQGDADIFSDGFEQD